MPSYDPMMIDDLERMTAQAYGSLKKAFDSRIISEIKAAKNRYENVRTGLKEFCKSPVFLYSNIPKELGLQRYLLQYLIGNKALDVLVSRFNAGKPLAFGYNTMVTNQVQGKVLSPKKYSDKEIKEIIEVQRYNQTYTDLEEMVRELTRIERYDLVSKSIEHVKTFYKRMRFAKDDYVAKEFKEFKRANKDFFKYFKK